MPSRLVHVTVVPAATISVAAPKLKLSIFPSAFDVCVCSALAAKPPEPLTNSAAATITEAAKTKINKPLLITFLPFRFWSDGFPRAVLFRRSSQRRVDHRQGVLPANIIHVSNSQNASQLLRRHLHRPRRVRPARLRLWKCRRSRGVKRHIAFDLLHRLMDMSVQHRNGAELFQIGQRLRAIVSAPAPLRINRPQRNVREHHNPRAVLQILHVVFQSSELFASQRSQSATLQVHDVYQPDEVHAFLLEAEPSRAL